MQPPSTATEPILSLHAQTRSIARRREPWDGHSDRSLMNDLLDALIAVERYWESSTVKHQHGWVNGRQYEPTEERFGILTVPGDVCLALNFLPWSQHAEQPKGQMDLLWLAERQRTRYVDWTPRRSDLFSASSLPQIQQHTHTILSQTSSLSPWIQRQG